MEQGRSTANKFEGQSYRLQQLPKGWESFIRYCQQIGHGEIEVLKIQDGVPVLAEITREKVKFG